MNRVERKLLLQTATFGVLISGLIAALSQYGHLAALERLFYDRRAYDCQFFRPPPSTRLVHLDIDDDALQAIGPWPWDRSILARIVDELHAANTAALAMDIVFAEPQPLRYRPIDPTAPRPPTPPGPDPEAPAGEAADPPARPADPAAPPVPPGVEVVHHDAEFARSLGRFGSALLPVVFKIKQGQTPLYDAAYARLLADPELTSEDLAGHLIARGFPPEQVNASAKDRHLVALREALYKLIDRRLQQRPDADLADLRQTILPRTDPRWTGSPLLRMLAGEHQRVLSMRTLRRFGRAVTADLDPLLAMSTDLPPIYQLARVAGGTGFVFYTPDPDGVVRSVPLFVENDGLIYPQIGLSLAAATLGIRPELGRDVELARDHVILRYPRGGSLTIPVHRRDVPGVPHAVGYFVDLPWVGPREHWERMYNTDPNDPTPAQHVSVTYVWQVGQLHDRIRANLASADQAIRAVFELADPDRLKRIEAQPPDPDDLEAYQRLADQALATVKELGWMEAYDALTPEQFNALAPEEKVFVSSVRSLPLLIAQTVQLGRQLRDVRTDLRGRFAGRAVILGWTATAIVADFVPTSLHSRCPGAVVHGLVFNAIMTGEFWWTSPVWLSTAITLAIGLVTTFAAAMLTPIRALLASMVLVVLYFVINGVVLFDYGNTLVGVAGPTLAVGFVWSGCTLSRFISERRERARITRRFRSYVDPALVNYVIENPERARLEGEVRQMTVVFTDLAGFTTLSERLMERTVPLLNSYMEQMVPLIRGEGGYVNKFLGDGIMFFFGAPVPTDDHALRAVTAVLRMQAAMGPFNQGLMKQDLPTVQMRVGISSGPMVVGDAGSHDASDYTVLGDSVNLGARLESANKATGTRVLLSESTAELARSHVLLRPVARLQVVGKSEGVMTYEPLALFADATDRDRRIADLSRELCSAFTDGDWLRTLLAAQTYDRELGECKLTALYRKLCEGYLGQGPPPGFDGTITLDAK